MENNVVTLETAKRLKAAGFPQETGIAHWWVVRGVNPDLISRSEITDFWDATDRIAAPTAQEIADQLPEGIALDKATGGKWRASRPFVDPSWYIFGDTMAEALALLWLKLHEASHE